MKTITGPIGLVMASLLAVLVLAEPGPKEAGQAEDRTESAAGRCYYLIQMTPKITAASRGRLEAAGIRILRYVSGDSFIVSSSSTMMARAKDLPGVLRVRHLQPAEKLSPGLDLKYDAELNRRIEDDRRSGREWADTMGPVDTSAWIDVRIAPMEGPAAAEVARAVESLGGSTLDVSSLGLGNVTARLQRELLAVLEATPSVLWIERNLPLRTGNDIARWKIQSYIDSSNPYVATPIHAHGIHGEGQIVTIADNGIDTAHPMFAGPGKIRDYYSVTDPECTDLQDFGCPNHGTHVAGIVAGDADPFGTYEPEEAGSTDEDGPHDGQAYGARIEVQDLRGDCSDVPYYFEDLFSPAIDPNRFVGMSVENFSWIHTNSWSASGHEAKYNHHSAEIDTFVHAHPDMTVIFIADNYGPESGSASSESVAKNVIGVGATFNGDAPGGTANDMWDLPASAIGSGRGPSADGRLKPDLLAPTNLWSARGCQGCAGCLEFGYYVVEGGTSNAAPVVAGAAALVRQYYMEGWYPVGVGGSWPLVPSAALIKATLINSAQEISGEGAYLQGDVYPNNDQGWGRILLDAALYFQGDTRNLVIHDERAGLDQGGLKIYPFYSSSDTIPLKATLVWSDAPGSPTDPGSRKLVNDLDLVVTSPYGHVYCGNRFGGTQPAHESVAYSPGQSCTFLKDNLNNVEGVLVRHPMDGLWTITVKAADVPMGPQQFALVLTGASAIDPSGQSVNPGQITSGTVADLEATSLQTPTTYETIVETGNPKKTTIVKTFTTSGSGSQQYDVVVEAFRNAGSNDNFKISYLKKTSGPCSVSDTGWTDTGLTISGTSDTNTTVRARLGVLAPAVVCIRIQDTKTSADNQADTLTLDRLYLLPLPVPFSTTLIELPNSDAGPNQAMPIPGPHYLNVDDDPHDGDSSFLTFAWSGSKEVYTIADQLHDTDIISSVKVRWVAKKGASGSWEARAGLVIGTQQQEFYGPTVELTEDYEIREETFLNNPTTTQPWTVQEVRAAKLIYEQVSVDTQTPRAKLTEIVLVVTRAVTLTELPNSDAGPNQGDPTPSGPHYLNVDDDPHDGDSSFLTFILSGRKEAYTIADQLFDTDHIRSVKVRWVAKKGAGDGWEARAGLVIGTQQQEFYGPTVELTTDYEIREEIFLNNPATTQPWTVQEVRAAKLIYEQVSVDTQVPRAKLTEIVLVVEVERQPQ